MRYEAFAREYLGESSWQRRRSAYSEREVIETYLQVLDGKLKWATKRARFFRGIADPNGAKGPMTWEIRDGRPSRELALRVTAFAHDFPSEGACRRSLVRAKSKLKSNRRGWRAGLYEKLKLPPGR